jgi:ribose transport system substrate-binding protein
MQGTDTMLFSSAKRYFLAIIALTALTALVSDAVCAAEKPINIVFIPKSRDQDFWTFMRHGVDKAILENQNTALTWRGPAYNNQTDSQIKILEMYTTPEVDSIILVPTDRARLVEPVKRAVALGIKVIVVDSSLDGNAHLNFIGTDNVAAGMLAAKHMSTLLHMHGNVLLLRTVAGSASTEDRASGFIGYLKMNAPGIRILDDPFAGGTTGTAFHVATELLQKYPQADGIFSVNESTSDGMLRALRKTGWAGKKKFIGFDSTRLLLAGLEQQEVNGLVVQDPCQMGYLGLKAAIAAAKNSPFKDRNIFIDAVMVTLENYQRPEIRALLVP